MNPNRDKNFIITKRNCQYCDAFFYDEIALTNHMKNVHKDKYNHKCPNCSYTCNNMIQYSHHCHNDHSRFIEPDDSEILDTPNDNYSVTETIEKQKRKRKGDKNNEWVHKFWNYKGNDDLHTTMNNMREQIKYTLSSFINKNLNIPTIKFNLQVRIEFARKKINAETGEDEFDLATGYFNNKTTHILDLKTEFSNAYDDSIAEIWRRVDRYIQKGSNWIFRRVYLIELQMFRYIQFVGSSYLKTPEWIQKRKCVTNIKNNDNKCFQWCVLAHKYAHKVNANSKYKSSIYNKKEWINSINWNGIHFPTLLSDFDIFEKNNKDWSVTVIHSSTERAIPSIIRKSKVLQEKRKYQLILLLIVDYKTGKQHYALVTNKDILCRTNLNNQSRVCLNCMTTFKIRSSKEGYHLDMKRYDEHYDRCLENDPMKITFPKRKKMKFRNVSHMKFNEFNITADFECLMDKPPETGDGGGKVGYNIFSTHKVFSVGMKVVSDRFQDQFPHQFYREGKHGTENAGYMFCQFLYENMKKINYLYETECNKPMKELTPEQEKDFFSAENCHICEEKIKCKTKYQDWIDLMGSKMFTDDPSQKDKIFIDSLTLKGPRVRDHCAWTGEFRGAAHAFCNTQYKEKGRTMYTSCFLHNGGKYDNHLILQNLFKFLENNEKSFDNPTVIAKTLEHFMQIKMGNNIVIKDSFNFMGSSLDVLVKNLKDEGKKNRNMKMLFKHTYSYFDELCKNNQDLVEEDFDLLTRKNVYPYEYMKSLSICEEKQLPPIDEFYSSLTNETISLEDYHHAQKVFNIFKCNNLGDYTDLYVLTDTLLLADVMENLRRQTYKHFKLDPVYYTSTPAMTLDCALKYTKAEFDILDDIDKVLYIDDSIIGGYSGGHKPYASSNNPLIPENYNPFKKTSYIPYLDANNLYGTGLSGYLPYGGGEWVDPSSEWNEEFIKNLSDCSDEGWFIRCDLHYPKELHNNLAHIALPLIPHHLEIDSSMLSNYQREIADNLTTRIGGKKVVTSFFDKDNIVLHYLNLKQALNLGLKLKKIHKIMRFDQAPLLKPYVQLCTDERAKCNNDFSIAFWKLLVNALFGKMCENVKKRRHVEIAPIDKAWLFTRKPTFINGVQYPEEKFCVAELIKDSVCLDKPRYVGSAILNISKTIIYDFHYNFIMKHFPETELLFTDTDSLCYHIHTSENIYDIFQKSNYFDMSNYPKTSKYYNTNRYMIPGKFKDECAGIPIEEVIALRSKMYSVKLKRLKNEKLKIKKVAKGITKSYQRKYIKHEDYKDCLTNTEVKKVLQANIRSHDHQLYTTHYLKNGISAWNDKRLIYRDEMGFYNLPLGHYLTTQGLSDDEIIKHINVMYPCEKIK